MNIWIVTDTHWHHQMMLENNYRPIDHQELLMKRWKRDVKPEDIVIHLGDVTFKYGVIKAELEALPGKKILVLGNHDEKPAEWWMTHGFDFSCEELQLQYKGVDFVFTHIPQTIIWPVNSINVCGHWHNNDHRAMGVELSEWHRLVAMESTKEPNSTAILASHRPINLKELIKGKDVAHCQAR